MRKETRILPWLSLVLCLFPVAGLADQGTAFNNQIILKYKATSVTASDTVRPQRAPNNLKTPDGQQLRFRRRMSDNSLVLQLPAGLTDQQMQDTLGELAQDPAVEYVQLDKRMHPAFMPTDPRYSDQWYLFEQFGINMQNAWDISTGSSGVVIAVLDTGLVTHPDLAPGRFLQGADLISDSFTANDGDGRDLDPTDPGDAVDPNDPGDQANAPAGCLNDPVNQTNSWHGLSVIGVMAATSDNSIDVAGIDFSARILPARVLGKCGGAVSDIVDAMRWAVGLPVTGVPNNATPAKVVNLSLSGEGVCTQAEQEAINAVRAAGAVVITAAGNEGEDIANKSPANCQGVIVVGATTRGGDKTAFVNFGTAVDVSAPSGDGSNGIRTLTNPGTTLIQGTSFTTAQVSAVASLMYAVNPALAPQDVEGILCSTTQAFPAGSTCATDTCGTGIVDAAAALTAAQNPSSVLPVACASNNAVPPPSKDNGGGGGGCSLNESRVFDPIWLFFLLLGLFHSKRIRPSRSPSQYGKDG